MVEVNTKHDFSWREFVEYAADVKPKQADMASQTNEVSRNKWAGGTFADAVALARSGWRDGAEKVTEMKAHIEGALWSEVKKPVRVRGMAGSYVDVGRYCAGVPECMISRRKRVIQAPVVTVGVSLYISAFVAPEDIIRRGAAIAAVVDALEAHGRRCEVKILMYNEGSEAFEMDVRVKEADQPLDIEQLAYALAHPSCLRRLVFSVMEKGKNPSRYNAAIGEGYGGVREVGGEWDIDLTTPMGRDFHTDESAAQWVRAQLEAQGVEFAPC